MVTKLIIIRHGNTFNKEEICLRIGAKTDLPLSKSGREQAVILGKYLKQEKIIPEVVFSSWLKRTYQTAEIAFNEAEISRKIEKLDIFNEIDYGLDEAKSEEEVIARIGKEAMELWNNYAIVPDGWLFNPQKAIENWKIFAEMVLEKYKDKTIMVFTSNGIARFSPHITNNFGEFSKNHDIKISTTGICTFRNNNSNWEIESWNIKPKDYINSEIKK